MSPNKIHKYTLPVTDEFEISMPAGARLLSLQVQHEAPCLWALVDTDAPATMRRFSLRGTGHECEFGHLVPFVGTFQLHLGNFVGHLFDLGEREAGS
jgi:hypothetical protein